MLGGVFSGSILFSFAEILGVMGEAHPLFPSQSSNYNTTDALCSMLKQVVVVKYWDYCWRLLVPLYESGKYQLSSNEQLLAPAGEILSLSWLANNRLAILPIITLSLISLVRKMKENIVTKLLWGHIKSFDLFGFWPSFDMETLVSFPKECLGLVYT